MIVAGDAHLTTDKDRKRFFGMVGDQEPVICVGDYSERQADWDALVGTKIQIVPGNHDPSKLWKGHPNALEGYQSFKSGQQTVMTIRGAETPSHAPAGVIRYPDEEMTQEELNQAFEAYVVLKPDIMITHCAPNIMGAMRIPKFPGNDDSRTVQMFEKMLDVHEPTRWIYGHYHFFENFTIGECQCTALDLWTTISI